MTTLNNLSGYIWINGELIPWQESRLHALTHSLHYSGAVFEGEKSYSGKIFKLEEHTERLINSAKTLMLDVPYNFDDIIAAHNQIMKKNNISEAYIRPLIWRGSESLNITNEILSVNLLIAAMPSTKKVVSGGMKLHLSRWKKAHPEAMPPQCKSSGNYNMMIVAELEAKDLGFDGAVLLDWRGYIAECTTTNIFFVHKDQLLTPIPDAFLNGITRQTVIEIAKKLGIVVHEKYITLDQIDGYDECFITGTAAEVQAVASISLSNDKTIVFEENRVTSLLKEEYQTLVQLH